MLTKRAVKHVNLVTHLKSGVNGVKEHNWVLLLEICEHIPAEFHAIFFQVFFGIGTFSRAYVFVRTQPCVFVRLVRQFPSNIFFSEGNKQLP